MPSALHRLVARISHLLAIVAAVALLLVVVIIMAEVVMRALRTPLVGGIEMIRVTFLIAVFFAFAHVIVKERDIRVDLMRAILPGRIMRALDVTASLVSALFFGIMMAFAFEELADAIRGGVYLEGRLLLPMWLPWGTIVLGSALAMIAGLSMALHYATRRPADESADGPSARSSQIS